MRLTDYTDYALRLMLYVAAHEGEQVTIREVAERYGISRTHLMKIAQLLSASGLLAATRGRNGGLSLGRPAQQISLGEVVRLTENDFSMAECFRNGNQCVITPNCRLKGVLGRALAAFMVVLDTTSLADVALSSSDLDGYLKVLSGP